MNLDVLSEPFQDLLESLPDGVIVLSLDGRIVAVNTQACALSGYLPHQLIDAPIEVLVPASHRAEHVALRSEYVANGGPLRSMSQRLDITLVRADHISLPVDIALNTIKIEDTRFVIATVRDATVRGQAEVAIKHEQALLSAMNHISAALLEGHDLHDTFRAITHHARQLVHADYAMLTVPNDDGSALVMRAVDGDGLADLEGAAVPYESSMAGTVIRDREPQLLADAATDPRMYRPAHWPHDAGPALFVPLHAGDEILGSLTVARRRDRDLFTVADIARVKTFAAHAAVALEDTRRQAAIHRLRALDEDRQRVAAALHDTVIGRVSSASLRLHGLLRDNLTDDATNRIWQIIDELDTAIKAIRDAVFPTISESQNIDS